MGDYDVRSAIRVLALLEALNQRPVATVAELAEATGLPRPTTLRLLRTLADAGYARQVSRTLGYTLAERVLRLSQGFRPVDRVVIVAAARLDAFTVRYKWPATLATHERGAMVGRWSSGPRSPLSADPPPIGQRFPMLTTPSGQVYLAFCAPAERDAILALLRGSRKPANAMARDPVAVAAMLAQARDQGYALRRTRPTDKLVGFAVPVLDGDVAIATIGMRYFASTMSPDEAVRRYLDPLRDLAAAISVELASAGGANPAPGR